jgi:drug/metabolite transporter (DMT)-like permease
MPMSLRLYTAAQVSSAIYLSPPVTMLWAWLMFAEPLSTAMFLGLAVTLFGVWLTSFRTASLTPPKAIHSWIFG